MHKMRRRKGRGDVRFVSSASQRAPTKPHATTWRSIITTIAWDGTTLAADSCSWSNSTRRRVLKVFKVKAPDSSQYLVAFAGSGAFALAVLAWMQGLTDKPVPTDFMDAKDRDNQFALVIDEQRRVWQLSGHLVYSHMRETVYAFGGGQEYAWGALEAGASAVQAVKIAIKRSDMAGLGVDSVRF